MAKSFVGCLLWVRAGIGLVLGVIIIASPVVNGITCPDALGKLFFCQGYLLGWGDVPYICCQGVATLNEIAISIPDRRAICQCLKLAARVLRVLPDRVRQIPQQCKINVTFPIDPNNIDCNRSSSQKLLNLYICNN